MSAPAAAAASAAAAGGAQAGVAARPPRPESPRRVPAGPLDPIPNGQHLQAAAAHSLPRPPSASSRAAGASPRGHSPQPGSPQPREPFVPAVIPAYAPPLAEVQQWLAVNTPQLLTMWCSTNAEPLLGGFLEGWMTMNAQALLQREVERALQPMQAQVTQLRTQLDDTNAKLADAQAQLADVQAKVQAQLLDTLSRGPSFSVTPPPPQPSSASSSSSSSPSAPASHRATSVSFTTPPSESKHLGLAGVPRKGSAGPGGRVSLGGAAGSEDGLEAQPDVQALIRKRMSSGGPLQPPPRGSLGFRTSTGLPTAADGSSLFASSSSGARGPVANTLTMAAVPPSPGEEVVADLSPAEKNKSQSMGRSSGGARPKLSSGPIDIIVVEDLGVAQKIAHAALTRGHYKVEVAGSGEAALDLFKKHMGSLKAVLMDIHLPGISGIETTQRIRSLEVEAGVTPVWIYGLTGDVAEDDLASYQAAGMNGCILKGKLLADAVRQAMEESQNGVQFVNLCDKQGAARTVVAPLPVAPVVHVAPAVPAFNGSVEQIRVEAVGQQLGTPRAPQPRQMMQSRYSGTGLMKPGVGLPSASAVAPSMPVAVGPNLLLVEDVRVSQRIALQALSRAGYKCIAADNGESAVEKYRQHSSSFRYIIMDINLPGISGIEATEQIRQLEKTIGAEEPLLIFGLTGNVDPENLTNYEAAGMNGCILKGKVLADALQQAIEQAANGVFVNIS